eukprot:11609153-Alexandrium_andersonii.AAC.1
MVLLNASSVRSSLISAAGIDASSLLLEAQPLMTRCKSSPRSGAWSRSAQSPAAWEAYAR